MGADNYSSPKSFASIATRALYNANSTCAQKVRAEPQTFEQHLWFVFHFVTALWYEILHWIVTGLSYPAKYTHEAPTEVKDNWHPRAGTEWSTLRANLRELDPLYCDMCPAALEQPRSCCTSWAWILRVPINYWTACKTSHAPIGSAASGKLPRTYRTLCTQQECKWSLAKENQWLKSISIRWSSYP